MTLTNSPFVTLTEHSFFLTTHLEGGKGFLFGAYMILGQWENEQRAFIWWKLCRKGSSNDFELKKDAGGDKKWRDSWA